MMVALFSISITPIRNRIRSWMAAHFINAVHCGIIYSYEIFNPTYNVDDPNGFKNDGLLIGLGISTPLKSHIYLG